MVELPDDAIEARLRGFLADVEAESDEIFGSTENVDRLVAGVAGWITDWAARVRAEAVADERQRITTLLADGDLRPLKIAIADPGALLPRIDGEPVSSWCARAVRQVLLDSLSAGSVLVAWHRAGLQQAAMRVLAAIRSHDTSPGGDALLHYDDAHEASAALEDLKRAVAAGSVPVATPAGYEAYPRDGRVHSTPSCGTAITVVPAVQPPTFEQLLTDPMEQFDKYSELLPAILRYLTQPGPADDAREALLRSVEEYRNAPPATASTSHLTRPAEPDEPRGVQGHAPGCEGWRPPQALGFGRSLPYLCVPGCPCAEQPEER